MFKLLKMIIKKWRGIAKSVIPRGGRSPRNFRTTVLNGDNYFSSGYDYFLKLEYLIDLMEFKQCYLIQIVITNVY